MILRDAFGAGISSAFTLKYCIYFTTASLLFLLVFIQLLLGIISMIDVKCRYRRRIIWQMILSLVP